MVVREKDWTIGRAEEWVKRKGIGGGLGDV